MPDYYVVRLERENVRRIREADTPLDGCTSWVDYATRHVHAGAVPCWQCAAREKALAELAEAEAQLDVTARDSNEWRAEAERNRAAYAEAMIRESRAGERIAELERLLRDASGIARQPDPRAIAGQSSGQSGRWVDTGTNLVWREGSGVAGGLGAAERGSSLSAGGLDLGDGDAQGIRERAQVLDARGLAALDPGVDGRPADSAGGGDGPDLEPGLRDEGPK